VGRLTVLRGCQSEAQPNPQPSHYVRIRGCRRGCGWVSGREMIRSLWPRTAAAKNCSVGPSDHWCDCGGAGVDLRLWGRPRRRASAEVQGRRGSVPGSEHGPDLPLWPDPAGSRHPGHLLSLQGMPSIADPLAQGNLASLRRREITGLAVDTKGTLTVNRNRSIAFGWRTCCGAAGSCWGRPGTGKSRTGYGRS